MRRAKKSFLLVMAAILLSSAGCARRVKFTALPPARSGTANLRVELTYDRNDLLLVKLSNVPDPSELNSKFTRYVLWVATPDRRRVINVGQLRVDKNKAEIRTLTPLHRFLLFITAEPSGDVMDPGPDVLFETKEVNW